MCGRQENHNPGCYGIIREMAKKMIEIWKPIAGYEGFYEVSDLGRIRSNNRYTNIILRDGSKSLRTHTGRVLKGCLDGHGYYGVYLSKNNNIKRVKISKLVARTFLDNPHNYKVVNHIDGIKTNDLLINLEWCDHNYNMAHAVRIGLIDSKGEKNSMAKLNIEKVNYIRYLYSNTKTSQRKLSLIFNVHQTTIGKILRNKIWIK